MGNRAVITTEKGTVGIYLHWNGGIESVLAFVDTAKERGYRDPSGDESYALARLCGVCHEFFGVECSTCLGIGTLKELDCDNHDNGVYVVGREWRITRRYGKGHALRKTVESLDSHEREKYDAMCEYLRESLARNRRDAEEKTKAA